MEREISKKDFRAAGIGDRIGRLALCGLLAACVLFSSCGRGPEETNVSGQAVESAESGSGGTVAVEKTEAYGETKAGEKTETGGERATGGETAAGEKTEVNGETLKEGSSGGGVFAGIQSRTEELFEADDEEDLICMQYYEGEPVQIRARWEEDPELGIVGNVYLYRKDGSRELLLEGIPDLNDEMARGIGLLAQDGSFYHIKQSPLMKQSVLMKWDADGSPSYQKELDLHLNDICQMADGTIVMLVGDKSGSDGFTRNRLVRLDGDTGTVSDINNVMLGEGGLGGVYKGIAAGKEGLLLMQQNEGIYEIDLKTGSRKNLLSLRNATAGMASRDYVAAAAMQDFRILENGEAQILWVKNKAGLCETLYMAETDKTVLVIRGYFLSDSWLKEQIAEFNRSNQEYYVLVDTAEEGVEWEDYARQTSIELATGSGPDILYGNVLGDYAPGVIGQGGYVDLRPYMESGGIDEEKYFPIAFCSYGMGDAVYGISTEISAEGWMMKGEVLGGEETPDIRTLVDALLAWPEEGMFGTNCGEEEILRSFLEGSESLWGMVDWERGVCDFSDGLFAGMLEVAGRYAYEWDKSCPTVVWNTYCSDFNYFCGCMVKKQSGCVEAGVLFDDGCYAKKRMKEGSLAVNTNSPYKQGAWEFISFLLREEAQLALADRGATPVGRTAFEMALERSLKNMAAKRNVESGTYSMHNGIIRKNEDWVSFQAEDVTEEWKEKYRKAMEEVRTLPLRTEPVLEIICQEAEDYFRGVKSAEQVAETVRNRVQLYLDENL